MDAKKTIESGKAVLGIEFGSTRIKAVLIDSENRPIAQGSHEWENRLVDGLWTYDLDAIWNGLQDCYANLCKNVRKAYDTEVERLSAIGISAMMHGYMAFDENKNLLVPFALGVTPTRLRPPKRYRSASTSTFPCVGASPTSTNACSTKRST